MSLFEGSRSCLLAVHFRSNFGSLVCVIEIRLTWEAVLNRLIKLCGERPPDRVEEDRASTTDQSVFVTDNDMIHTIFELEG